MTEVVYPRVFKVELVVAGDATYCAHLKGSLQAWANRASPSVLGSWVVPASKIESDARCHACGAPRPDHEVVRLLTLAFGADRCEVDTLEPAEGWSRKEIASPGFEAKHHRPS